MDLTRGTNAPRVTHLSYADLCCTERYERVAAECPAEPRNRSPDRLTRDGEAGPCVRPEQRRAMRRHGEAVGVREGGHVLDLLGQPQPPRRGVIQRQRHGVPGP